MGKKQKQILKKKREEIRSYSAALTKRMRDLLLDMVKSGSPVRIREGENKVLVNSLTLKAFMMLAVRGYVGVITDEETQDVTVYYTEKAIEYVKESA